MFSAAMKYGAIVFVLAACAGGARAEAPLQVLASIKPLQLLAVAVGGSEVRVTALLDPRGSPHDYQLRPSDRAKLDAANVVFWVGPRLEHFLQPALKVLPDRVVKVALDDGGADPHLWLDPIAMRAIALQMAAVYARLRPAGAQLFYANAERVGVGLERQDAQLRAQFAALPLRRQYMVEHDAYGRFESRYGLQHVAALTDSADLPPSVAAMMQIRGLLDRGVVGCVLAEAQESTRLHALLDGRQVRVIRLDPMAGGVAVSAEGSLDFFRQLGESVLACLKT
jgi:zinc transport system substrate-binding protein